MKEKQGEFVKQGDFVRYHKDCGGRIIEAGTNGGKPYCMACKGVVEKRIVLQKTPTNSLLPRQKLLARTETLGKKKKRLLGGIEQ